MSVLLKFKDANLFNTAGEVREFFDTPVNQNPEFTQLSTVPLILDHHGRVYLQLVTDNTLPQLIHVNRDIFNKKIAANDLRFWFDPNNKLLTLARSLAAGIMSQTAPDANTDLSTHLQESVHAGIVYVIPIVMLAYLFLQYTDYYHKTGHWLSSDDLKFRQMLRDTSILGIQTLIICISLAIARAGIPFCLQCLSFLPTGLLTHLVIALMFGLIFATSLLIYDIGAMTTGYGQLTISPGSRFFKNLTIGMGLYLVQLIPGLASLAEFENLVRAGLAFMVPNMVNYTTCYLSSWKNNKRPAKPFAPELDDPHDKKISLMGH